MLFAALSIEDASPRRAPPPKRQDSSQFKESAPPEQPLLTARYTLTVPRAPHGGGTLEGGTKTKEEEILPAVTAGSRRREV